MMQFDQLERRELHRREFITLFGGAAVGTILLVEGTGVPERHVAIQNDSGLAQGIAGLSAAG
jgi:hypothetical protein